MKFAALRSTLILLGIASVLGTLPAQAEDPKPAAPQTAPATPRNPTSWSSGATTSASSTSAPTTWA